MSALFTLAMFFTPSSSSQARNAARALLGEDGDAVFPGGASAEHAIKLHARFGGELQVLDEFGIAYARRQIDEWLAGCAGGGAIVIERFLLAVGLGALERSGALDELQVHRDLDLQHIHAVAVFGELLHRLGHNFGLQLRVLGALLVQALFVADEFEKEWDVVGLALVADALGPGVLRDR